MVSVNAQSRTQAGLRYCREAFSKGSGNWLTYDEAGGYGGGIDIIDPQDMENEGGTTDDILKKIADSTAIDVPAQLKILVMMQ